MSEATISHLKNHLPEIVHEVEKGQDVQITRHGKAVAVIISQGRYERAFGSKKGVFNAYLCWRSAHPEADGFTDDELDNMRDKEAHRSSGFSWG